MVGLSHLFTPLRQLALPLLFASCNACAAPLYATRGNCGGFPQIVGLQVPPGHCLALVADESSGLRFPRRILEVAPNRYWIVDMGSWQPREGRLLEMTLESGKARFATLLESLDRPLGIAKGPDGRIYVGEAGRIWRTPISDKPQPEVVVDKLPATGAHPLKELVFGTLGRMYFNMGSATDACRDEHGAQAAPCPEGDGLNPRAAVYEVSFGVDQKPNQLRPYAVGLRNSLALVFVRGPDVLLQGENSIDYPDEGAPPEELNLLQYGRHYSWPYCVGNRMPARGYEQRHDCSREEQPLMLWPAHAAPFQMIAPNDGYYGQQLIVAWHGYREGGHRIVSYTLGDNGRPRGMQRTLVGGWEAKKGVNPLGTPAGVAVDRDGRLFIVEDRNKTVLMLVPEAAR